MKIKKYLASGVKMTNVIEIVGSPKQILVLVSKYLHIGGGSKVQVMSRAPCLISLSR